MMERCIYKCDGLRPLNSDTVPGIVQAAQIFANRMTRHRFGRQGRLIELRRYRQVGDIYHYRVEMTDGGESVIEPLRITKVTLPSYTQATAMEAALLASEETQKPYVVYCRSRIWNVVVEDEFAFNAKTPGLTEAIRVRPNGRTSNALRNR